MQTLPGPLHRATFPEILTILPPKVKKARGLDVISGEGGNGEIKASVDPSLAWGKERLEASTSFLEIYGNPHPGVGMAQGRV